MESKYDFGYPKICTECENSDECPVKGLELKVEPYHHDGNEFKLMLIGQDPTVYNKKTKVKTVLMLEKNPTKPSQLQKWLYSLLGEEVFDSTTVYATNIVKCTFLDPPATNRGKQFLRPYFNNCKKYLTKEVENFKPSLVLTFGEPAHRYFSQLFDNKTEIIDTMQGAFGRDLEFFDAYLNGFMFKYSPTLHIKTFRVAEIYGDLVKNFKMALSTELLKVK